MCVGGIEVHRVLKVLARDQGSIAVGRMLAADAFISSSQ
jgi:hypothetical protein